MERFDDKATRPTADEEGFQASQVAAELIGDQVLDTVAGPVEALALTADLAALELPLAQGTGCSSSLDRQ